MASEAISERLILKISLGEHAPRPPYFVDTEAYAHVSPQWPYQSKIAGSGPGSRGQSTTARKVAYPLVNI